MPGKVRTSVVIYGCIPDGANTGDIIRWNAATGHWESCAEPEASTTQKGFVELATITETNTGTDTKRGVIPDGLAGSVFGTKTLIWKVIAVDTALETGDGLDILTIPAELNGFNLVTVGAHVYTVSTDGLPTFQLHNKTDTVDILSTLITIDENELDSKDAATPPVINDAADDVATGDEIRIDCDVAGTGTKGLEIRMGFRKP